MGRLTFLRVEAECSPTPIQKEAPVKSFPIPVVISIVLALFSILLSSLWGLYFKDSLVMKLFVVTVTFLSLYLLLKELRKSDSL